MNLESERSEARALLIPRKQEELLRWWDELEVGQRQELLLDISGVPWTLLDRIIPTHVLRRPVPDLPADLSPPAVFGVTPTADQVAFYAQAQAEGVRMLQRGEVGAFTVAGGQGTRLGIDGPKGCVMVTPVGERTLFALFAESILAARRRYGVSIPWYIMTSEVNDAESRAYFESRRWFGLPRDEIRFFPQGMLPVLDHGGSLLLDRKHRLARAPDGHGGSLKAFVASGAAEDARKRGVRVLSYFQVDNPLVKPFDPLFLGMHAVCDSEMSTKVLAKSDDLERVGNVCLGNGRMMVVEYSDFPEALARRRNGDGSRVFNYGNAAIHAFDLSFIERVVAIDAGLPYRRADKIVPFIDETGRRVTPTKPNAVKLESFVFDALPMARRTLALEIDRTEEFSPVKNATGADSLEQARRDQVLRAYRWLDQAGVPAPRNSNGEPEATIVISPLFAACWEELRTRRHECPPLKRGQSLYVQ